jgi:subtilase family serine protease
MQRTGKRSALVIVGLVLLVFATISPQALSSAAIAFSTSADAVPLGHKSATHSGLSAADIRSAYNLSRTAGKGRTVAVVTAYNDPKAASDLAIYRKAAGLKACTTKNGCFRKVNQAGGKAMPKTNRAWAGETSLDIEMVSAACPACKILLVQAKTASPANLAEAEDYAATQKVSAISNSYAVTDSQYGSAYDHPGIAIVAAGGDSGYGAAWPASYNTVIAVGGTSLKKAHNARGWKETAWRGGGSLCATSSVKPGWQTAKAKCAGKAVSDVSAVADPNTGVAVYIGTKYAGTSGWQVTGGTSVASPIIAAVYAMSGRTAGYPASYTWAHASALHDVTKGKNGRCSTAVWCTAGKGWDGPTGLGTPNGTSAF